MYYQYINLIQTENRFQALQDSISELQKENEKRWNRDIQAGLELTRSDSLTAEEGKQIRDVIGGAVCMACKSEDDIEIAPILKTKRDCIRVGVNWIGDKDVSNFLMLCTRCRSLFDNFTLGFCYHKECWKMVCQVSNLDGNSAKLYSNPHSVIYLSTLHVHLEKVIKKLARCSNGKLPEAMRWEYLNNGEGVHCRKVLELRLRGMSYKEVTGFISKHDLGIAKGTGGSRNTNDIVNAVVRVIDKKEYCACTFGQ